MNRICIIDLLRVIVHPLPWLSVLVLAMCVMPSTVTGAGNAMSSSPPMGVENHSAHMKMMTTTAGYVRSVHTYAIPDIELLDADGKHVRLKALLSEERPIILNFIFTSCTTICPILTATLSQAEKALQNGGNKIKPLLISISIDPQFDTPARLREYASRYQAGNNWYFLTGEQKSIITVQRAFNAYYGTKMNHQPLSFLHRGPEQPWVRLQGFTSSANLVAEYRALFTHSD